jgi:hypothetical protein
VRLGPMYRGARRLNILWSAPGLYDACITRWRIFPSWNRSFSLETSNRKSGDL